MTFYSFAALTNHKEESSLTKTNLIYLPMEPNLKPIPKDMAKRYASAKMTANEKGSLTPMMPLGVTTPTENVMSSVTTYISSTHGALTTVVPPTNRRTEKLNCLSI